MGGGGWGERLLLLPQYSSLFSLPHFSPNKTDLINQGHKLEEEKMIEKSLRETDKDKRCARKQLTLGSNTGQCAPSQLPPRCTSG